jgi:hypothetical protein
MKARKKREIKRTEKKREVGELKRDARLID